MGYTIDGSRVRPAIFSSNVVGKVITLSSPLFLQLSNVGRTPVERCQHMEPARIRQQRIPHYSNLSLKWPLRPRLHHCYSQQLLDTRGAQPNSRCPRSRTSLLLELVLFHWRLWGRCSIQGNNGRDQDKRFLDEVELYWCVSFAQMKRHARRVSN